MADSQPRGASTLPVVHGASALVLGRREGLRPALDGLDDFVGREAWLARLEEAFRGIGARGTSVLVEGEPGIGKTRLLQRFGEIVRAQRAEVLIGHGCTDPGSPVLWPFIEILQGLVRKNPQPRRDIRALRTAFEPWLPDDASKASETTRAKKREPVSQFMLVDSLIQLVLDAAERGPLCLVLEDVHEFDDASLQLLRRLLLKVQGSALMVLASCRSGEEHSDRSRVFSETLHAFTLRLSLTGMSPSEVGTMLQNGLGSRATAELARAVHHRAEGNPLYVKALMATLQSSGVPESLPVSVLRAGQRLLDCLTPDCRRLLRTAAVFGREFSLHALVHCADVALDAGTVEALVGDACRQRVLCRSAGIEQGYRFTHALLHEVLERELEPAQRSHAHAQAARALQLLAATHDVRFECSVARHWLECGTEDALALALQLADSAARAAEARGAHAERAVACGIAVAARRKQLGRGVRGKSQTDLGRKLIAFGAALWRAGQLTQALAQYAEAAELAREIGDHILLADAVFGALGDYSAVMSPELLALCELACQTCTQCPIETQICLLARLGAELWFGPRRSEGIELIERAVRLGAESTDSRVQFALARAQHLARDEAAPFEVRRRHYERHLQLALRHHDWGEAVWAHARLVLCAMEFADATMMQGQHQRVLALAPRAGEFLAWWAHVQACMLATLRGHLDQACQLAEEARQLGSQVPNAGVLVFDSQWTAILRLQGRTIEAVSVCERLVQAWDRPEIRAMLAQLYSELDRVAQARLELERALAGKPQSIYALCRVAEAAHSLGDAVAAARVYPRLTQLEERCAISTAGVICIGAVAYYAALAALTLGEKSQAIRLLRSAIVVNRAAGAMPSLAFSLYRLAGALDNEAAGEAAALARNALQLAQGIGMHGLAAAAEALSAELARPPESYARDAGQRALHQEFRQHGEFWHLSFRGQIACVRDQRGMHYLHELLAEPGQPKHVLELIASRGSADGAAVLAVGEGLTVGKLEGYERALDGASLASYRKRVRELVDEAQEADAMNDLGRQERVQRELEFVEQQLRSGSKARHRPTERARKAVYNRIRQAIQHIEKAHLELARHLVSTIKTGSHCEYAGGDHWTTSPLDE